MLDVFNLCFDYQDAPLLTNIHFSLPKGHLLHLKGPNGSGKTTLLKLIAGLFMPHRGEIYLNQAAISKDLAAYQQKICFIGHKPGYHAALSVRENCLFDLHYCPQHQNLEACLQTFDLLKWAHQPCSALSMGQKRRVSLVKLLFSQAQLWLLDESFTALDQQSVVLLAQQISMHIKKGGMVIATSHQPLPDFDFPLLEYNLS